MRRLLTIFFCLTILASCAPTPGGVAAPQASPPAHLSATPPPARTRTLRSPVPTATLTYRQAMHPYTIEGLRGRKYSRGKIALLGMQEEAAHYTRYGIEYPSDGLTITGILQVPTIGEAPYPVIVMNHGFFSRLVYHSGDGTDRAAEFLNKRGYLTLSPDYRSWGGSDFGPSLFYSGLAIDVVHLLAALPSLPQADPDRVGMWGHSMGGGVTMKVLTVIGNNPALNEAAGRVVMEESESRPGEAEGRISVRAAVLYSTVSADQADVLARWGLGCYGDVLAGEAQAGCNSSDVVPLDPSTPLRAGLPVEVLDAYFAASTDAQMLARISPIHNLQYVTVPIQIHYGTRDGEDFAGTPPEWSKELYQALLDAGREAKLFGYEGERHSFIGDSWFHFMEECARFFDEHVKNAP